ncbi:hypothetical protein [Pyrobaculum aerophilum]|uniref:hypothetical protein n=1 Tax=Pyrobaculum aerophilum TaxID=13773 RepID=UPI002FDA64E9
MSSHRWLFVLLISLLVVAQKIYVYEVESDIALSHEKIPHVPGMSWRLGEQVIVVLVPRDVEIGLILFTNKTAEVPVYDRTHFLLAIPADARPSPNAKAEAFLRTPDGVFPVVFRKPDKGIVDITARSKEEALHILRQLGFEPEFRGKAELRRVKERGPAEAATLDTPISITAQTAMPSLGSMLDVYGGLYFAPVVVSRTGSIIIPRYGTVGPCSNLPTAVYVGYDARSLVLGTLITGGTVSADLIIEVYKIVNDQCIYIGSRSFILANKTRYWVDLVNPTNSVDQLAVFVYLNVKYFSGQPKVGINGSVLYTRTYRHGFEIGEFVARTTGASGYSVNNYVGRLVIGPYIAYDGYVAGTFSSALSLTISTDPVNGACKDMSIQFRINGLSSSGTSTYRGNYNGLVCIYNVVLPSVSQSAFQTEYSYAKAFAGGLAWVLDIKYTDGSTPYVRQIHLSDADAFRYWRWAEQWKTRPDAIDGAWLKPFLSSAYELYAAPTEPSTAPGIYHGLVTVRTNSPGQWIGRVVLTISGKFVYPGLNQVVYIKKAELYLYSPNIDLSGSEVTSEGYLAPGTYVSMTPPQWVEIAQRVKDAIDFILGLVGIGGGWWTLLSFAIGQGLQSAGDVVKVTQLDNYNIKIEYQRGWGTNIDSDTIVAPLKIPSLTGRIQPTELVVKQVCLDGFCAQPNFKAYVQPDSNYGAQLHATVKNWMFRGQTQDTEIYR